MFHFNHSAISFANIGELISIDSNIKVGPRCHLNLLEVDSQLIFLSHNRDFGGQELFQINDLRKNSSPSLFFLSIQCNNDMCTQVLALFLAVPTKSEKKIFDIKLITSSQNHLLIF